MVVLNISIIYDGAKNSASYTAGPLWQDTEIATKKSFQPFLSVLQGLYRALVEVRGECRVASFLSRVNCRGLSLSTELCSS